MAERNPTKFPFDLDFQRRLMRYLLEDTGFAYMVADHLEPEYFESEILAWAMSMAQEHRRAYGTFPTLPTLRQYVRQLPAQYQPLYQGVLDQVAAAPQQDMAWLRDATLDFVKRNLFVRTFHETKALYNAGREYEAYDIMMQRMDKLHRTTWEPADRSFFFRELPLRQAQRMESDPWQDSISTGLPWLDGVLDGGLSLGEMGLWLGYAKTGKSIMLNNLGAASCRQLRKTLHIVCEGSRKETELRYDAHFMDEWAHAVKRGEIDSGKYVQSWQRYQEMQDVLVIRAFTEKWDYTVSDVYEEIKSLEQDYGWAPEMIVLDYLDLLAGRERYDNETEKQKAVTRDLKSLAKKGYRVWSASQARRPEKGAEDRPHWIFGRDIADAYEKIRTVDFAGSVNATLLEREHNVIRLMAELYRGGEAGKRAVMRCWYGKMIITQEDGLVSPSIPDLEMSPGLGYRRKWEAPGAPQQQQAF